MCVRATVRKSDGCGCESVLYEYFTKVFLGGHSPMTSVKFSGLFTPFIVATTSLTPIWPASSPFNTVIICEWLLVSHYLYLISAWHVKDI